MYTKTTIEVYYRGNSDFGVNKNELKKGGKEDIWPTSTSLVYLRYHGGQIKAHNRRTTNGETEPSEKIEISI